VPDPAWPLVAKISSLSTRGPGSILIQVFIGLEAAVLTPLMAAMLTPARGQALPVFRLFFLSGLVGIWAGASADNRWVYSVPAYMFSVNFVAVLA